MRVGIEAPRDVSVLRSEVAEKRTRKRKSEEPPTKLVSCRLPLSSALGSHVTSSRRRLMAVASGLTTE